MRGSRIVSRKSLVSASRFPLTFAGRFPTLEPPAKRLLRLTRSATSQETLHADIFIQIRPVDTLATGNETPVGPLRRCPMRQTRKPGEGHRNRPAIRKFRDQSIIAYTCALGLCVPKFSPRSTHAMTSTKRPRFPRPAVRYVQFPPGQSLGSSPSGPVPAKTSPFPLPARHARGAVRLDPPNNRTTGMARAKNGWQRIPVYTASRPIGSGRFTSQHAAPELRLRRATVPEHCQGP